MTKTISVLAVNAGSSSIKLGLFTVNDNSVRRRHTVSVTGIGQTFGELHAEVEGAPATKHQVEVSTQATALSAALDELAKELPLAVDVIAQRVVYGGALYTQPTMIDDEVMKGLESYVAFDPRHMPAAIASIRELAQRLPGVPQVASFDTAFFVELPTVAKLTTLPRKYYELGLRRYGFHGLSYEYLLDAFRQTAGDAAARGRVIIAHLGSGASITALRDGKPLDTTMGFSPASGIPMSSRSGDIDPGVVTFLRSQGIDGAAFDHIVTEQSGLLGISELSADMLTLLQHESFDPQAAEAIELFCYAVRKTIGAFAAVLGGVDSIIFSGGIGEQAPLIRARICEGLEYLGVDIDHEANAHHARLISSTTSSIGVHSIPTDEAQILCRNAYELVTTNTLEER